MIAWYAQLPLYLLGLALSFVALYQIDFNKFMRIGKFQVAILVYIILSLALWHLVGKKFIEIGDLLHTAIK